MDINLSTMTTEMRNPATTDLDIMTPLEVVTAMNREDASIAKAIRTQLANIAQAVEWAIAALSDGGRMFYIGAGTSGRLGVLDAAECPPTFGVSPDMVVGLIAGGEKAFIKAVEGAEDDADLAMQDLKERQVSGKDIVVGLAASGRTPYVMGGLKYAHEIGAHAVAICCNASSAIGKVADIAIEVVVGPEVLTGSTRLKAGTAQKMVLNMLSTATMAGLGKVYQNLMVDVFATNEKLRARAENIVIEATGVDRRVAKEKITEAGGSVKKAITMILADCDASEAEERLRGAHGHVREAIK